MGVFEKEFFIEFGDVGENNSLTAKGVLRFLQEIAVLASDKVGYGINNVDETHLVWILLNWKVQIFGNPIWNSKLKIRTWARSARKLYSYRDFEMFDENNNLICIASSKWVLLNIETNSIERISNEIIEKYEYIDKRVFPSDFVEKLEEPENIDNSFSYIVQRRDIDTNHHVNNLNYLDFAYNAIPDDVYDSTSFKNIEIMYKKSAVYREELICLYSKTDENTHVVTIKSKDLSKLHAIVKLY